MHLKCAVIGSGFLGSEIALYWKKKGHHVTTTTRHLEKLKELAKISQKSVILKGDDQEALAPVISHNDAIAITIAPDHPDQYETAYLHTAQAFRHLALEMNAPRHLIYTSSTSVYGDHLGFWVDETSPLHPKNEPAKILIETEKTYLSLQDLGWIVSILRLGELYGPGREVSKKVKKLEGHPLGGTGDHYVNLTHSLDAVMAIDYALRHHLEGIYNVVSDDHPTRKELYDKICQKFHFPPVVWNPSLAAIPRGNKRVSNHKIKAEGFSFHHPHILLD